MGRIANAVKAVKEETKRPAKKTNVANILDAKKKQGPKAAPSTGKLGRSGTVSGVAKPPSRAAVKKAFFTSKQAPDQGAVVTDNLPRIRKLNAPSEAHTSLRKVLKATTDSSAQAAKDVEMQNLLLAIRVTNSAFEANDQFFLELVKTVTAIVGQVYTMPTYARLLRMTGMDLTNRRPFAPQIERGIVAFREWAATIVSADGGKQEAIEAAGDRAGAALTAEAPARKVAPVSVQTRTVMQAIIEATNAVAGGVERFPVEMRESILPYVVFFERFWVGIESLIESDTNFNRAEFETFLKTSEFKEKVSVGEYARFRFRCGSRVIVLRALVGAATLLFAENEFMSGLKGMPFAPKAIVDEQEKKHHPTFSLMANMPFALSNLVSESKGSPGLSLVTLSKVFGDPIFHLMQVPQANLAVNCEELGKLFAKFDA